MHDRTRKEETDTSPVVRNGVDIVRPTKCRKVCSLPSCTRFGPLNKEAQHVVSMTVEEYETIRLIDLESYTQEECARQMGIARTTVQTIYQTARRKLAQCLVKNTLLHIEGGTYEVCEHKKPCGKSCCRTRNLGMVEQARKEVS